MKRIIIALICLMFCSNSVFAIEENKKVISDSDKQQELLKSFDEVNQYTDGLFKQKNTIQKVVDKQREEELEGKEKIIRGHSRVYKPRTLTPVKRIRLHLKEQMLSRKQQIEANTKEAEEIIASPTEQIVLDCDYMEYFAERTELEATGNVSMRFPQNGAVLEADKIIYNQTTNKITAAGHVVITKDNNKVEGDYLVVNMNEENAILDNPQSEIAQILAKAKVGYVYGDDVIQEQGSIYITKKTQLQMRSNVYGPMVDEMVVPDSEKSSLSKDVLGKKIKLKISDIIIDSKKEHDTITVKKADIYFNDKKVGYIPALSIHTNKNKDYMVMDNPEFGTMTDLGMYAGPGFVFDTPHGSTLKLTPIINYQSGGDRSSLGVGAWARFRSATNRTDIAYGTANNVLLVDGIQYLDDNLFFQYGANRYMDDWFMGQRKARMMGELVYQDSTVHRNFLGKNRDMTFSHRLAAGYMQDGPNDSGLGLFDDSGIGTFRGKYMAEVAQNLYKFNDRTKDVVNASIDVVGQGSFAVYGTGDTQALVRFGPRLSHQYKRWMSEIGYYLAGVSDNTPFTTYDRYVYGGSSVYLRESVRLSKYLTLSWLGSFNLSHNQERYRGDDIKLMSESAFFLAIGPDDIRLHVGYDIVRQQSFVHMTMDLDAKGATFDYDKMIVKNPERLNEKKKEILFVNNVPPSATGLDDDRVTVPEVEKAEVEDIVYDERL